ncbi:MULTISPECIES: Uma2 family endonuclease [Streptomyces]|uniref:Uma2 family endonuclease n=1 Tax=Streptomyces TaxID=1883 RepID=UPI002E0E3209
MTHAPSLTSGEFERLAALAAQGFETVRFEFLNGRICVKGLADGNHAEIIRWLQECMRPCAELWLYSGVGIKVCEGRALPDAVLAPRGTFVGKENWADTADVVMTVEVTSYDADTHRRDREEKPLGYADAGYRSAEKKPFGAKFSLPEPLGIEIDTEDLKQYVG